VFARLRRPRRGWEEGGSAVEFALLSPVLIALVFGVFELGWALHCSSDVRHALEATGRTLELNPTYDQSALTQDFTGRLTDIPLSNVVLTYSKTTTSGGVAVGEIDVTYTHPLGYPVANLGRMQFHSSTSVPLNGG